MIHAKRIGAIMVHVACISHSCAPTMVRSQNPIKRDISGNANEMLESIRSNLRILTTYSPTTPPSTASSSSPSPSTPATTVPSSKVAPAGETASPSTHETMSFVSVNREENTSEKDDTAEVNVSASWLIIIALVGVTIMAWAARSNAHVRQKVSTCCAGDFCFFDDSHIPEEIILHNCKSDTASVVGDRPEDIELIPVSTFENAQTKIKDVSATNSNMKRNTSWASLPSDPVGEISLKGSSFYCSDDDDEDTSSEQFASEARYVLME